VDNNKFKYSDDKGKTWKRITFEKGAYEFKDIIAKIRREIQSTDIDIDYYKPTLQTILDISNEDYMVDFGIENSIGSALGFTNEKLSHGVHQSPNIIDIEKVNSIRVHCDIITGSYVNNKRSNVIYKFTPRVSPGYKIIEEPWTLRYLPVVKSPEINSIRLWLTDQNNKPIDLMGERIDIDIEIREY